MIVRHESDGSLVMITQNDHAKAAGFCASHWGNADFEKPRPFDSSVRAAFLHDLAWFPEETTPRFDSHTGRTPNYLDVPNEGQIDAYKWANEWIFRQDSYAALLVSKHRTGIWRSRYGIMKQPHYPARQLPVEIETFVDRLHTEQEIAVKAFNPIEVATNYHLLQIWDLFSLYICSTEYLTEQCFEPVPVGYNGRNGVRMRLAPSSPSTISVDPFPFNQPSLPVNVSYRRLAKNVFENEEAFRLAYFSAPQQIASFTFCRPTATA